VFLSFLERMFPPASPTETTVQTGEGLVELRLVRHRGARRYTLRLGADGAARVTIPRGGSRAEAIQFVRERLGWLAEQVRNRAAKPPVDRSWRAGTTILFRGDSVVLEASANGAAGVVRFAGQSVPVRSVDGDLRPAVERHLWRLAACELPPRVVALAARYGSPLGRVTVRNQRSRWGSCSPRGTISLNWRLIQTPAFVQDYTITHELMHFRHMDHSARFWCAVELACPDYQSAEQWLKDHDHLLR
jgi:predicted metal-dependent hydrolase